jgi:hypothetical protein
MSTASKISRPSDRSCQATVRKPFFGPISSRLITAFVRTSGPCPNKAECSLKNAFRGLSGSAERAAVPAASETAPPAPLGPVRKPDAMICLGEPVIGSKSAFADGTKVLSFASATLWPGDTCEPCGARLSKFAREGSGCGPALAERGGFRTSRRIETLISVAFTSVEWCSRSWFCFGTADLELCESESSQPVSSHKNKANGKNEIGGSRRERCNGSA